MHDGSIYTSTEIRISMRIRDLAIAKGVKEGKCQKNSMTKRKTMFPERSSKCPFGTTVSFAFFFFQNFSGDKIRDVFINHPRIFKH